MTINLNEATTKSGDKASEQKQWRLCFNPLYKSSNAPPAVNAPSCGDSTVSRDNRVVSFVGHEGARVELHIMPRSAFAIFKYLGRIVAGGERARITLIRPRRSTARRLTTTSCSSSRKARSPAVS